MQPTLLQLVSLGLFVLALVHVFLASHIEKLSHRYPAHSGVLHLLGEIEVVFGLWAAVLFAAHALISGAGPAIEHLEGLNFHEPLFVFVVMVVAGCRPVIHAASGMVERLARLIPLPNGISLALVILGIAPLLGSLITEPAAMTVAALILRDRLFVEGTSTRLRYAALAILFVNISIGGVLTSYAAPPVLMVAAAWNWDSTFMFTHFGFRAILAVVANAVIFSFVFRKELTNLTVVLDGKADSPPLSLVLLHLGLVGAVVWASHHTVLFIAIFLFFLGIVQAYRGHHSQLLLKEALLVGFFLAGLVVLGSPQGWWLSALVANLGNTALFFGAMGLTAVVDNAALTYLGSLLPDTSAAFRYHLVAGAVVGGGLTVIANAPNPAGASILRDRLPDGVVQPGKLLAFAIPPTLLAALAFIL